MKGKPGKLKSGEAQSYYVYAQDLQHISNTCYQLLTKAKPPQRENWDIKRCWNDERVLRSLLHNTNNSLTQCALKIVGGKKKQPLEDISAL